MHILILPSEEFVPVHCPLAGIFQYHQASILRAGGHKIGVISITQSFSIPMLLKAAAFRIVGKNVGNATDGFSIHQLWQLGYKKMYTPQAYMQTETKEGIEIYRINGFYYKPPVDFRNDYGWVKAGMAALQAYIQKHGKPEIIHAHNAMYAGLLAQEIQKQHGIPYVLTEHSTAYARGLLNEHSIKHKIGQCLKKASGLFAVSKDFCALLNSMFAINNFQYLPNVLDPYLEAKPLHERECTTRAFRFINIAELHPKKDHLTLLKAFELVHRQYPEATLYIGGDGELKTTLETFIAQHNLGSSVTLGGSLSRAEVYTQINKADCFILSSLFETFGVVVIEAMLYGKPVIVTECGGPQSFVDETCGYTVACANETQMAQAMLNMIANYKDFNNQQIRAYTIDLFGGQQFYNRMIDVYEKVVDKKCIKKEITSSVPAL